MAREIIAARSLTSTGEPADLVHAQLCASHRDHLVEDGAEIVVEESDDFDRPCDVCGTEEQHEQQRSAFARAQEEQTWL